MKVKADPWICADGPHSDVVLSCRARLARNIDGFPFVSRATPAERHEVVNIARQVLMASELDPGLLWVDLTSAPPRDRRLLVERHLISSNLAESEHERAVAIAADESLSVMINEEDHLRMQVLAPGLQLEEAFRRVNEVDDSVEARIDFAFDRRWGYLTACPTNVGTGMRVSVMLHLPALKITNEINRVRRAAKDLHLAVRGYYGEGSESCGDFYQISNQVTLGPAEVDLLDEFNHSIIPRIIDYEHKARKVLLERNATLLDDRIHRALAVLRSARLLGSDEAMKLLSRVRLGVYLERLTEIPARVVNRLFLQIQPAHLQSERETDADPDELRELRADMVRRALCPTS